MDAETWHQHKDRPAFVREHREAIHDAVDVSEEIPDGPLHEVRNWLDRYKSTVTKQLEGDDDE